jgi:CARDB
VSSAIALAGIASIGAASASGSASTAPHGSLQDFVCQRALDPGQRTVSVTAVMRHVTHTRRLEVRFVLLSKSAGTAFAVVNGTGLGTWVSPTDPASLGTRPGDVWRLSHPVADLPAPATYRFVVTFKWIGDKGRVIRTEIRESRTCYQPELRPDLVAESFTAQTIANHPKKNLYSAVIKDTGLTGAGPFQVQFTFGTDVVDHTVEHINAHAEKTFTFTGPICDSSAPPTMTIDPDQQVDVYSRTNTSLSATCPAPTPTS